RSRRRGGRRGPPLNGSTGCRTRLLQAFGEGFEQARARRVSQLAQRLGLDLAYALARHVEVLADLFERVLLALRAEAVAEFDDDLLARAKGSEHGVCDRAQVGRDNRVGGADARLILDEVAEVRILFLADGSFQRDWLLRQLAD